MLKIEIVTLVFPDAEFYGFLRDHNYNENQVTKIGNILNIKSY